MRLSELHPKEKAIIKSIGDIGKLKNRLMEFGVLCGEPVQIVRIAPLGDPIEMRIGDEYLALRYEEAQKIEVEVISPTKVYRRKGVS